MNQKCKTKSYPDLPQHCEWYAHRISTRDTERRFSRPVISRNENGSNWTASPSWCKYLRSKQELVARRQEGFVHEIVCLSTIYHYYSQA